MSTQSKDSKDSMHFDSIRFAFYAVAGPALNSVTVCPFEKVKQFNYKYLTIPTDRYCFVALQRNSIQLGSSSARMINDLASQIFYTRQFLEMEQ